VLRKTVQAERQAIALAHGCDFKVDPVGSNADEFDIWPTRNGRRCHDDEAGLSFLSYIFLTL
jgi:hypothetical protein